MKQLIAKKRLDYAGKRYNAGAVFAASAADARLLVLIGSASLADIEPKRRYKRRDMQASP